MPHKPNTSPTNEIQAGFYARLESLDLLLTRHYYQLGHYPSAALAPFLLSEEEVDDRLEHPVGAPWWLANASPFMVPADSEQLNLRLQQFAERFWLNDIELDILLAGLLTLFSSHYAPLLAQINEGRGQMEVPLLLASLPQTHAERQLFQQALWPTAPLFRDQLLCEISPAARSQQRPVITDPAIWRFLQGEQPLASQTVTTARWLVAEQATWIPAPLETMLLQFWATHNADARPPLLFVEGTSPDAAARAIAAVMAGQQRPTLSVDLDRLNAQEQNGLENALLKLSLRDAILHHGCLLLTTEDPTASATPLAALARRLEDVTLPPVALICSKTHGAALAANFPQHAGIHFRFPTPSSQEKAQMLRQYLPARVIKQIDAEALSQRYHFYPHTLPHILQEATHYRWLRDGGTQPGETDLVKALTHRSRQNFGKLAQRITPQRTFADLVLAPEVLTQLKEILAAVKQRANVAENWFASKLAGKLGISALFYGESGTGKTLAAEVLANQLATDLVKVDLSTVVNKYVGETEKNLARIFDLAEQDAGVLFFDEADALFGKRSETKDAHDRHANIEVSYLLQRLESYPGLVILATNNRSHLDNAFNRRFTFITRFPHPDDALRAEMWRRLWPETLPLASDVRLEELSGNSHLTGANMRNIALLAAMLAAEAHSPQVEQRHLELALKRELAKSGRTSLSVSRD